MNNVSGFFIAINAVALACSFGLIWVTVTHYSFFAKSDKNELGKRLSDAFFADCMSALSILAYAIFNVFIRAHVSEDFFDVSRYVLKAFQAFTVAYNLRAMYRLHNHIKKVH